MSTSKKSKGNFLWLISGSLSCYELYFESASKFILDDLYFSELIYNFGSSKFCFIN